MPVPLSDLSLGQAYREAKAQFKRNPERRLGNVKPAFAQKLQWHVWNDGVNVRSMLREVTKKGVIYSAGPVLSLIGITSGSEITACASSILKSKRLRLDQLGIIVHYAAQTFADQVRTVVEIGADPEGLIQFDPTKVIKANIAQFINKSQWVYVPGQNPTALRFSSSIFEVWTSACKNLGLLSLAVVSSPLEMLTLLEASDPGRKAHQGQTGHVIVIRYSTFTFFAATNKEGITTTLRFVQNTPRGLPAGFAGVVSDACATQGGTRPALTLLSMVPEKPTTDMAEELEAYVETRAREDQLPEFDEQNVNDLEENAVTSLAATFNVTITEESLEKNRYVVLEAFNCEDQLFQGEENERILELRRIARTNIYRRSAVEIENEMEAGPASLLHYSRWLIRVGVLAIIALGAYLGWNIYQEVSTESYQADPAILSASTSKLQTDTALAGKMKDRKNLLTTRSTYFIATEPISRLFLTNPQNNLEEGPILKMNHITYALQINWSASLPSGPGAGTAAATPPEAGAQAGSAAGTAPAANAKPRKGVEMVRVWHVDGVADQKGREEFETISSTENIKDVLDQIAADMNVPTLKNSKTIMVRNVRPTITRDQLTTDAPGNTPYHFTLDFEQVIRPNDPNALTNNK